MKEHRTPQQVSGKNADLDPSNRPGVPMEWAPHPMEGAHAWSTQPVVPGLLKREGLTRWPLVFGTAQLVHGLSGLLRKHAYAIPEHRARHWAWLLFADRVDVAANRFRRLFKRGVVVMGIGLASLWLMRSQRA
jgi:hypothetical protein